MKVLATCTAPPGEWRRFGTLKEHKRAPLVRLVAEYDDFNNTDFCIKSRYWWKGNTSTTPYASCYTEEWEARDHFNERCRAFFPWRVKRPMRQRQVLSGARR